MTERPPPGDEPAQPPDHGELDQVSVGAVVWFGLFIVGASAAVLSFSALADLAYRLGITATLGGFYLAWLFPLAVDVFAAVATCIWLRRRMPVETLRFARGSAWSAIGATVVGNAYHGWIAGDGRVDAIVVSAVPAAALGALVHLAVLVGQGRGENGPDGVRTDGPGGQVGGDQGEPTTEQLVDLVVSWAVRDEEMPSRERIRVRYGVGSKRADRVRTDALAALTRWDPDVAGGTSASAGGGRP